MNPWELQLTLLGWELVGIVAIAALLFLLALIVAAVKVARGPKAPEHTGVLNEGGQTVIYRTDKGNE